MDKLKLKDIILKTLEKEGGAAGLKALKKATKKADMSTKGIEKDLSKMSGVKQHQDGDYISTPINDSKRSELELWVKKSQKRVNPDIVRREIQKQRGAAQAPHSMARTNPRRIKQLRDKYFDYLDNIDVEDRTMPFPWGLFIPKGVIVKPGDIVLTPDDNLAETSKLTEVKEIIEIMLEELSEAHCYGEDGRPLPEAHCSEIYLKEKKKDRCHRKADSVYGTKTSAYKSGAIVRCRKGKIWKAKK